MCNYALQGLMEHHKVVEEYFNRRRVSAIFLFRRNLLRRMVSVLANTYDKDAKPLNGTHKSHVHSPLEVSLSFSPISLSCESIYVRVVFKKETSVQAKILAKYKPRINTTSLIPELKQTAETAAKAIEFFKTTRHIVLYYEDLINNRTVIKDHINGFNFIMPIVNNDLSSCFLLRNSRMFKNF